MYGGMSTLSKMGRRNQSPGSRRKENKHQKFNVQCPSRKKTEHVSVTSLSRPRSASISDSPQPRPTNLDPQYTYAVPAGCHKNYDHPFVRPVRISLNEMDVFCPFTSPSEAFDQVSRTAHRHSARIASRPQKEIVVVVHRIRDQAKACPAPARDSDSESDSIDRRRVSYMRRQKRGSASGCGENTQGCNRKKRGRCIVGKGRELEDMLTVVVNVEFKSRWIGHMMYTLAAV
ncbi:hypothetical protein CVT25_001737 [Psilocybe cyanescens]|uniref:Uncharacterized protein n=1 Tax=Psilocybe cyanescens TaxID=93625 RepID=A0A409W0C0_PSICY|nr:hypothetical protein CVT25_001737 [Psilocybe cyanescens]